MSSDSEFAHIITEGAPVMPPPPEPVMQDVTPSAPAEPDARQQLVSEAHSYGLQDADLEGMSESAINSMLAAIDRRAASLTGDMQSPPQSRQQQPSWQPGGHQPQGAWPPQPSPWPAQMPFQQQPMPGQWGPAPQPPGSPPAWQGQQPMMQPQQIQPFKLELDADEFGEGLSKTLKQMNDYYAQQLEAVNRSLQTQQTWYDNNLSLMQQQQEAQYSAWFDAKITELGDGYKTVFGSGSGATLNYGSQELGNRMRLNHTVNMLSQVYPTLTDDELFVRALRAEFGQVQQQIHQRKLSEQVKGRSQKTIGRPGRRTERVSVEIDPETGMPKSLIDETQRDWDRLRAGRGA